MGPEDAARIEALRLSLGHGPVEFRARGGSMRPVLADGTRVRLESRAPRRGDIALVASEAGLVLHRLLRRRGALWQVRGDARPRHDGWVHGSRILGIAVSAADPAIAGWRRLDRPHQRAAGLLLAPLRRGARRVARRAAPRNRV